MQPSTFKIKLGFCNTKTTFWRNSVFY
jgi:hypothetical protein